LLLPKIIPGKPVRGISHKPLNKRQDTDLENIGVNPQSSSHFSDFGVTASKASFNSSSQQKMQKIVNKNYKPRGGPS
jgi:hypothetical protein